MGLEDRTEQATPQHRHEARKKGQVARSAEITSTLVLLAALMVLRSRGADILGHLSAALVRFLGNLSAFQPTQAGVHAVALDATRVFLLVMAPLLGTVVLAGVVANVGQVGFMFTTQPLVPDMSRMDPVKGLGRMFSGRGLVELAKSLAKVSILGFVVYAFLRDERATVVSLGVMDHAAAGRLAGDLVWRLCVRVCSVLLVIASLDYMYQRFQFEKSIRMTKQEVKEEFRRSEGDPLVKSQFRQRHRQMMSQRMMQDVPKADVVITNPTHIAVALRYDSASMAAPVVVAKGQRLVAERIKETARKHRIPCIENRPVARALFKTADVGQPVPVDLYQAVAEILAFVYRLRHGAGYRGE